MNMVSPSAVGNLKSIQFLLRTYIVTKPPSYRLVYIHSHTTCQNLGFNDTKAKDGTHCHFSVLLIISCSQGFFLGPRSLSHALTID